MDALLVYKAATAAIFCKSTPKYKRGCVFPFSYRVALLKRSRFVAYTFVREQYGNLERIHPYDT
jgi:hypothetical protein